MSIQLHRATINELRWQVGRGWMAQAASSPNAALTVTQAAESGKRWVCTDLDVGVRVAVPVGEAEIRLKDGTDVIWRAEVRKGLIGSVLNRPFKAPKIGSLNTAMVLEVDALGLTVISTGTMTGYYI